MANNEFTIPIPARLKNVAKGGHVAGTKDIIDDALGKEQSEINQERIDDIAEVKGGSTKSIADLSEDIANETERASSVEAGLRESIDELGHIGLNPENAISTDGDDFDGDTTEKRSKIPTIGAIINGNPGVYDVSKRNPTAGPNSDGKFTLDYILDNANTLIPTGWRHGGMTISFVHTSDNKYVQYRYMESDATAATFTNTANWQGVDDKPTAGSNNLVLSKGIYNDFVSTFLNDNVNIQTLIGKFSLVESSPEITTQDNKFLNENGFVQDITNDAYKVLSVNVSAGEIYKISAYTSPATKSLFAYYKDTSLIANFVLGLNVTDYYLIIPSGVNILYTQKLGSAGQIKKVTPQKIQFTTGEAISTVGIEEKPTPNSSNIPNSGGCYQNMVNAHLDDSYEMASLLGQFDVSYITPTITQTSQYISANGVIKNIESEVYKLLSVDVIPGEIYKITAAISPATNSLYAFYNGETLVANFVLGSIIYDNIVFIPSGVNKLYVQKLDVNGSIQKVIIDSVKIPQSISNDVQYSKNFIESNFVPTEKITNGTIYTNKYILANGTVADLQSGTYVVEELPVTPYAAYTFYYSGYANKGAYSFMDENGNVLDVETIPTGYVETQVTRVAPNGAAKLNIVHVYNARGNYRDIIVNGQPYNIKLWKGRKWVVVGDSLTEVNNRTTKHYYDFVKDATGIEVYNMGVSGTGYKRTEENNNAFYQRISNVPLDADVITIFGSFNDNPYFNDIGDITDTGTQTLCGCVNTCLDNLFTVFPLANVGIVSPTPWIEAYPGIGGADRYVQMLENICKHRGIPYYDLYHDSSLRPWEASYRALCYSRDDGNGVHPDEHGHKIIAPRFRAFLESLLI